MGVKHIQGEVRINDEKVATQDWLEDTYVEPLRDELETNNAIMTQGGLHKQENIVDIYDERITAKGENVLDNSEAVLKKVVGSTVRCENLIPFPYNSPTKEANGITFTVNSDGSITIKGTATEITGFQLALESRLNNILKAGNTYCFSGGLEVIFSYKDESGTTVYKNAAGVAIEWKEEYSNPYLYIQIWSGDTVNKTIYPMLNEGSTALPYQPYFTGLKSASFAGIESGGRNLTHFPYVEKSTTKNGITFTVNNDGSITVNGTATAFATFILANTNTLNLDAGKTYCISGGMKVIFSYKTETGNSVYKNGLDNRVIEWKEGYKTPQIYLQIPSGATVNETIYPMLNHGSTALPYTPYIEPTVFNFPIEDNTLPMGTTIDFENKKIIEGSREIPLKGTENWSKLNTYKENKQRYIMQLPLPYLAIYSASTVNCVSSRYANCSGNDTFYANTTGLAVHNEYVYIYDEEYATKTIDEFKAHIAELYASGNPVTVRYLLATPTEKDFTKAQKAVGNKYQVWANGTEKAIGNEGKEYGANNEFTQNYTIINAIPKSGYADQDYVNNKFLPKTTTSTTYEQAYVKASSGSQSMMNIAATPVANTIVKRDSKGQVLAEAPTSLQSATPRNYVDEITDNLQKELTLINTALTQSGIVYTADVEDTYNERITADGLNTLDNSEAILKKVVGSTVKCENLIPYPYTDIAKNGTVTLNGITFTDNGDGTITINGTATAEAYLTLTLRANLNAIGDCFISGTPSGGGYSSYRLSITNEGTSYADIGAGKVCSLVEGVSTIVITVARGATLNNLVFKPMLNEGSTKKPYQPYFTGLKNASFAGIESTGRNLFNINGNLTAGKRIATSDGGTYNAPLYSVSDYIFVKGSTYVAVSGTQTENGQYYYAVYDENKKYIRGGGYNDGKYVSIPTNAYYLRFDFLSTANAVMANAGSTALPFTPYIEPSVLNFPMENNILPMGTTIDFENKKIVEGSKEIVLDGTENWRAVDTIETYNGTGNRYRFRITLDGISIKNQSTINSVSSQYISVSALDTWDCKQGLSVDSSADSLNTNVSIFDEAYATKSVEEFKAHLAELYASGNPVVVRYFLKTPTETAFTEEQKAVGNKYQVWSNGTERVIDNDGKEYGANNTLTQNYIAIKEV